MFFVPLQVEDDLIIFPDDIEFKRVPQCTTGRVFVLKFKSSSKRMFFWMQEPKDDKDEEFCKKVNDLLNNPPQPGSAAARGGGGGSGGGAGLDLSSVGDSEITNLLSNMSQQQLVQLLNGAGGPTGLATLLGAERAPGGGSGGGGSGRQRSTARAAAAAAREAAGATPASSSSSRSAATAASAAAASSGSGGGASSGSTAAAAKPASASSSSAAGSGSQPAAPIQLSDLQNILSGINVPKGEGGAAGASGPSIDLSSGLTAEAMKPLLQDKNFVAGMKDLLPPEHNHSSLEEVANEINLTVQSPQFQQALGTFSSALQTGQLAPLVRNFNLGDDAVAAANSGDMEAFVKAVVKHQEEKKKKEGDGDKKKDDEPEDMALD